MKDIEEVLEKLENAERLLKGSSELCSRIRKNDDRSSIQNYRFIAVL